MFHALLRYNGSSFDHARQLFDRAAITWEIPCRLVLDGDKRGGPKGSPLYLFITSSIVQRERLGLRFDLIEELLVCHRTEVSVLAGADGHHTCFHVLVAYDEHIRHFFKLGFSYLETDLFATQVAFRAHAACAELCGDVLANVRGPVGKRHDLDLHGSHPQRERARVFFDKHGERTLIAAYGRTMDYHGTLLGPVFVDVSHIETLSKTEVDLYGDERVFFAPDVGRLQVELGTVERRLAVRFDVVEDRYRLVCAS